jgi:hypothetical protein
MHPGWLLPTALLLPLVWGWFIHWLWVRLPVRAKPSAEPAPSRRSPVDYQI